MNLAQLYSLTSGQKIDRIHVYEKFYPLPFEDYVVIQPWSKVAKNYTYHKEVIDILLPIFQKANLKLVQVGGPNEPPLAGCYHTQGSTNFGQLEYIISKAKLVISTDSVSSHLAGHYDKPLVVLISNNFSQCVRPYFGNKSKQIVLEPDRTKKNPSFAFDEGAKKQIDEIKPELIAESVCSLLGIDFNYRYKSVCFGDTYHNLTIESVPNQAVDLKTLGIDSVIMRMDYHFDERYLSQQLQTGKCTIVTNKPIDLNLLRNFKPNIKELVYILDGNHDPKFAAAVQSLGINCPMLSELSDEYVSSIKMDYMDLGVIHLKRGSKPKAVEGINIDKLYYRSKKYTLSNGRIFPSKAAYLHNLPIDNFDVNFCKTIDDPEFWKEEEYFYFLTEC